MYKSKASEYDITRPLPAKNCVNKLSPSSSGACARGKPFSTIYKPQKPKLEINSEHCAFDGFNQKQLLIHGGHSVGDLRCPELQRPQRAQALQHWGVDCQALGRELPQAQEDRRGRIARWVDVVGLVSQATLDLLMNVIHQIGPGKYKDLVHLFCSAEKKDCVADAFFPLLDRAAMALHGYYSFQVDKSISEIMTDNLSNNLSQLSQSLLISKFFEYFLRALFLECYLTEIHVLPLVIEVNSNPDNFGRLSDSCQVSFDIKVIFHHSNILEALMYTALLTVQSIDPVGGGMEVFRSTENLIATAIRVRVVALREKNWQGNHDFRYRKPWKASAAMATAQSADAAAT
ncbi:hypothetical protein RJ639_028049 [Escallonia herrerae]|uniref:Uncharacterized protein n=1 Tax=Escallonia herrerae TaxID=1293975 RepID=A0AA89BK47_9ASTE|nr:hypothetical protein RJ639_028049 [Escallonia herrerae]